MIAARCRDARFVLLCFALLCTVLSFCSALIGVVCMLLLVRCWLFGCVCVCTVCVPFCVVVVAPWCRAVACVAYIL